MSDPCYVLFTLPEIDLPLSSHTNLTLIYPDLLAIHAHPLAGDPTQNVPVPPFDPATPSRRRPARTLGLTGSNAAFLVPDHIRKKFHDGWNSHVPLTFLTDKGCLMKDKSTTSSTHDILTIDNSTGRILATPKPLSNDGELDLTFDEWHQAWRRLLDLIKEFIPSEFLLWEIHYSSILNNVNRAELWPLYLAYDAEIRRRATQLPIDPSIFSVGIWNDLEARYTAKKVFSLVQSDLRQYTSHITTSTPYSSPIPREPAAAPRLPSRGNYSFRIHQHNTHYPDNPKTGRCIFCGDRSKIHMSRNCPASCNINGTPCHLLRQEPSGTRTHKSGKRYCYSWNGPSGCDKGPLCRRGEHWCTLCGSSSHNAQQCNSIP